MKSLSAIITGVLLTAAFFVGGCTTDTPIFTNPRAARIEGVELYNRTDYENAAGAFRNAVKQEPRDFRSHYYLGLTYEHLGNYQQAIQAYKSAMKVVDQTPGGKDYADFRQVIMNTLASCIRKHDDNGLELDLLQQQAKNLKAKDTERAEAYFLLAKIDRYRRDADSAMTDYYKAAMLDQNDFWLQKEAGLYLLQMGKKRTAAAPLQRAAWLKGRDPEVIAANQELGLKLPTALFRNPSDPKPVLEPVPLPAVDVKAGDTPVALPDQLPVN